MKEYRIGNLRVQLLSEEIVRVECAKKGKFSDGNTLNVPDREKFKGEVKSHSFGNVIFVGEYALHIPEFSRTLNGLKVTREGATLYSYKHIENSGELPAVGKTPEVFALADSPRITLPEGGYTYRGKKKNSGYKFEENADDIYLLFCKKDAKKLRSLYVELTGRCELVRLSTLGLWNSKWYAYSEKTAKELILDYEKHKVPLDNMVIDTDWRVADSGVGYDINRELFPSMKRFLNFAHAHGVEIMFNDHPEPAEGAENVFSPAEVKLRESKLIGLLKLGVDTWWYDRNWHVKLKSPVKGVNPETLGAYVYGEITKHHYEKQAGGKISRRPVIMCNADNIENGVYRGINSSASHRYSVQWTGDIPSDGGSIKREVENLIKASDNCVAYINSDCGGHTGNPDEQTFIRWMQFGALSPVFRPHCTKDVLRYREPWVYGGETLDTVRGYVNLRYRLLPVIYKNAYNNYATGEPIFKSLGWEYPGDKRALTCVNGYMLGNNILIFPVTAEDENICYLPKGEWLDVFGGKIYAGGKTVSLKRGIDETNLFIRLGGIIPLAYDGLNAKAQKWDRLVYDFYPSKESGDRGYVYEDDGETTAYKYGGFRKCPFEVCYDKGSGCFTVLLSAAQGGFGGERAFLKREITFKYHLLKGAEKVNKVTVNGADISCEIVAKDGGAFPLSAAASPTEDALVFKFTADLSANYEIKFYVG